MRTERAAPRVAAVAVLALCAAGAARGERLASNSELLRRVIHGAVDSVLAAVPVASGEAVVVMPAAGQSQEWALENELAAALHDRAHRVTFHGPLEDSASAAPGAAAAESAAAAEAPQRPARPRPGPDLRPLDPNADRLEYRVAALGVSYTHVYRRHLFGPGDVERLASASVGLRLIGPDGHLLWSGHASGQYTDRVPQSRIREVDDRLFQVPAPVLPERSLSRLVEPAIVVGLVTGLIYLFYTNRN
ncbi:MAG TPA: hypothetical protein VMS93_07490 [Candidatus Saccharimonadales bacterium]|nr:hypothetical protein [Candidatus Saccharimonadales bacterium]